MTSTYFALLALVTAISRMAADDSSKLRVVDFISGGDSQALNPAVDLVKTPQEWVRVWQYHRTAPQVTDGGPGIAALPETADMPAIDFRSIDVLAIFGGSADGISGYEVVGVGSVKHHAVIRLRPVRDLPTGSLSVQTMPYAFLELTRIKSPIDVEMLAGVDKSGSPVWRKIGAFNTPDPRATAKPPTTSTGHE